MTQAAYQTLFDATRAEMHDLCERLAKGSLTVDDWADEVYGLLEDSHSEAFALGRQRAGVDESPRNSDDDFIGRGIADNELSEYLEGFVSDLEDGRYSDEDGNYRADVIKSRLDMYAHRLRGTANEAFTSQSPAISVFRWRLGDVEHCDTCLNMEAQNPWTADTLYRHPADGTTICKVNCSCFLERHDGITGFKRASV